MSILITIGGFLLVIVAGVVGYFIARKGADRGVLPQYKLWNPYWIPITLLLDDKGFEPGQLAEACKEAIKFWNEEVGFRLFMDLGDVSRAGYVTIGPKEGGTVATSRLTFDEVGMIKEARIEVQPTLFAQLDDHGRWRAMAHELGHCLGLDHDDIMVSVMYSKLPSMVGRPTVMEGDILLLRKIYRPPE